MRKYNIIEQDSFFDAPLDQNVSEDISNTPTQPADANFGMDSAGMGNFGMDNTGMDASFNDQMQFGNAPNVAIVTYSDVGKIWVVKELNKIISNLLQLNITLMDVSYKFVKFYEDLMKVQELLSIALFNFDKYKDRFDVIIATVKLFLVEYFKEMLLEIEEKVKDQELKRKVKLMILKLEEKFYKKVKKETKELKKKEKENKNMEDLSLTQTEETEKEKTTKEKENEKKEESKEKKNKKKEEEFNF